MLHGMSYIHKQSDLHIYFGDAQNGLMPHEYNAVQSAQEFYTIKACADLKKSMQVEHLLFVRQVHGTAGILIQDELCASSLVPFSVDGDFLSTNLPHCGIGVVTADCLPIVLYAPDVRMVSVVHAGWRGADAGILREAVTMLQRSGASVDRLQLFFGPSAKECCYQVKGDFYHAVALGYQHDTFRIENGNHFFNLPLFVQLQLLELGILRTQINTHYNVCTICNNSLYSYRRQGMAAGRQMSVACLR